jgi:hypothetical protein
MKRFWALALLLLLACDRIGPLNSAPPSYIKNVAAYKEGSDGIVLYIVLADSQGAMTIASGKLRVEIVETTYRHYPEKAEDQLFWSQFPVDRESFRRAKVGMGAFEHELILFTLGRITYDRFLRRPTEISGKVKVEFVTDDQRSLKGEETIIF